MTHFIVAIFSDEASAAEGLRALQAFSEERRIARREGAVVGKDADGRASVKGRTLPGAGIGALIGGLLGSGAGR